MVYFLSCDWGTSSFRLRLVKAETEEVVAFKKSDKGIAATFSSLTAQQKNDPEERRLFYLHYIQEHIHQIEQEHHVSLEGVPLVVSGMASSSIGMVELPYRNLPFCIDGEGVGAAYYEASTNFPHPVLLISGIRSDVDVMRGEETQLIGSIPGSTTQESNGLYIFPGTHSKHILVKGRQVTDFRTYMTGEVFELLSNQSILKAGVEKDADSGEPKALQSFKDGVKAAKGANLLHSVFRVRTNDLFGKYSKKENYHYLSGLLIGTELENIKPSDEEQVFVCSDAPLKTSYETALEVLGLKQQIRTFSENWAEEAVVRGQLKIYRHYNQQL
ncbi:2-dehydro-3-deoxygalactonokinase [Pontibacter brevis]